MRILKQTLVRLVNKSKSKDLLLGKMEEQDYEFVYLALQNEGLLSFKEYQRLKHEFQERNKYLSLIKITAPTAFADKAIAHLLSLFPKFQPAEKDKSVKAQREYDVFCKRDGQGLIKIEVKAGRAVDKTRPNIPYERRAFSILDKDGVFDMNFQQMKPDYFDVAILMGVWTDKIKYWVLSSKEMRNHKHFSPGQHRGNKGNEGQIHVKPKNLGDFKQFEVEEEQVLKTVLKKASR